MDKETLESNLTKLTKEVEFGTLRDQLNKFDPFKVLKVERQELRHTTTLAWLLDPQQTHGLGDSFLRAFLTEVSAAVPGFEPLINDQATLTGHVAVQPELRLIGDQLVSQETLNNQPERRKRARINGELDVLIESEKWALAIEAKIDSKEGKAQLKDYLNSLEKRFPEGKKLVCFYLTVQPEPEVLEKNPKWLGIQWGDQVAKALKSVLEAKYGSSLAQALEVCPTGEGALCEFLHSYKALLDRLAGALHGSANTVQALADKYHTTLVALEADLQQRGRDLSSISPWSDSPSWSKQYWEHRDLLNMLIGSVRSPEASFTAGVVKLMLEQKPRDLPLSFLSAEVMDKATVRFVPEVWTDWQVRNNSLQMPLHALMFYRVAFRTKQKDIEVKLLLPQSRGNKLQVELVKELTGKRFIAPAVKEYDEFIYDKCHSLKLYTMSLKWEKHGSVWLLKDGANEKIVSFWEAVQEHTSHLVRLQSDQLVDFGDAGCGVAS